MHIMALKRALVSTELRFSLFSFVNGAQFFLRFLFCTKAQRLTIFCHFRHIWSEHAVSLSNAGHTSALPLVYCDHWTANLHTVAHYGDDLYEFVRSYFTF